MTTEIVMQMIVIGVCGFWLGWFFGRSRGYTLGTRHERQRWLG